MIRPSQSRVLPPVHAPSTRPGRGILRRSGRIVLLLPTVLGVACRPEAPAAPDALPVLFGATRDGRVDLHLFDPASAPGADAPDAAGRPPGTTRPATRPVVTTPASEVAPSLAPDGVTLAFHARTPDGTYDLFLATPDSSWPLAATSDWEIGSAWSPDGREVAYFSTEGLEPGELGEFPGHLYALDPETGHRRRLTRTPLPGTLGPSDWSADGRRILMARRFDGQLDVVGLDVRTGEEQRLTDDPEDEYGAAFSPDGRSLAFHVETDSASQIAVLDLSSGRRRILTDGPGWRYSPRWSPDGRWLLLSAAGPEGGPYDLVALRVADGVLRPLVATPDDERYGIWIPRASAWVSGRR